MSGIAVADAMYKDARTLVFLSPVPKELAHHIKESGFDAVVFDANPDTWATTFMANPNVFGSMASVT